MFLKVWSINLSVEINDEIKLQTCGKINISAIFMPLQAKTAQKSATKNDESTKFSFFLVENEIYT